MNLEEFKSGLQNTSPPSGLNRYLLALWHDRMGNWQLSHEIVQDIDTQNASWIHAYLHRKEGDKSNALYWYTKAGKNMPDYSLEKEWEDIVRSNLEQL